MDPLLAQYPDIISQLDDSETFENSAEMAEDALGRPVVLVTQTGKLTAGQAAFVIEGGTARLVAADSVIDLGGSVADLSLLAACGGRSAEEHARVAETMRMERDKFQSGSGPDGGNLACVWTVAHIIHEGLGIWVTRKTGTAEFAAELKRCFGTGGNEGDLPDGAIIISPTGSGNGKLRHGHIGLLGEREGTDRHIYSNSSSQKVWQRNWTLSAWRKHYGASLDVLFFPLPTTGGTAQPRSASGEHERDKVQSDQPLVPLGVRWAETMGVERLSGPPFEQLKQDYRRLYDDMVIAHGKLPEIDRYIDRIIKSRPRYEAVAGQTGVPWHVVALIHLMEGSLNFATHLHNGDPLTAVTSHVPKGRPKTGSPPFTWEESAVDALAYDGLTGSRDWSIERTAYRFEGYNGFGYRLYHPTVKSPYLWSYSNQYVKGKYREDGKWDPEMVSDQAGAMVVLRRMYDRAVIV